MLLSLLDGILTCDGSDHAHATCLVLLDQAPPRTLQLAHKQAHHRLFPGLSGPADDLKNFPQGIDRNLSASQPLADYAVTTGIRNSCPTRELLDRVVLQPSSDTHICVLHKISVGRRHIGCF